MCFRSYFLKVRRAKNAHSSRNTELRLHPLKDGFSLCHKFLCNIPSSPGKSDKVLHCSLIHHKPFPKALSNGILNHSRFDQWKKYCISGLKLNIRLLWCNKWHLCHKSHNWLSNLGVGRHCTAHPSLCVHQYDTRPAAARR